MRIPGLAALFLALLMGSAADADPPERVSNRCSGGAAVEPAACLVVAAEARERRAGRSGAAAGGAAGDAAADAPPAPATVEELGAEVVRALFGGIADRLRSGEEVRIPGFGTFALRERPARAGRNPRTGRTVTVPPRRVVLFRPARSLKRKLNLDAAERPEPGTESPDSDAEPGEPSVRERPDALDDSGGTPDPPIDGRFLMPVEDVFSISGRGTVVTGRVERGVIKVGDEVEIVGLGDTRKTEVTGIEMFRRLRDRAEAGENVGVLLRGIDRDDVERGQVLAEPGSIRPHARFEARAYILSREEGGRHTPFFASYRPQFYFRTTDVTGTVGLPEDTEMVMPGDEVTLQVELIDAVAMEEGLRFAIREGGRTVGAGVVTRIIE